MMGKIKTKFYKRLEQKLSDWSKYNDMGQDEAEEILNLPFNEQLKWIYWADEQNGAAEMRAENQAQDDERVKGVDYD